MRSIILVLCLVLAASLVLVASGCQSKAPSPQTADSMTSKESYVLHTVSWSGETMGAIAAWYTGSAGNWPSLATANPEINVNRMRIGSVIRVPQSLCKRQNPFTQQDLAALLPQKTQEVVMDPPIPSEDSMQASLDSDKIESVEMSKEAEASPQGAVAREASPNDDLFFAAAVGDLEKAKAALANGADKDFISSGRSILGWAAQTANTEVLNFLIAQGAALNHIDGSGHSALMRAIDTGQQANVLSLLAAKADVNIRGQFGDTALLLAVKNNNPAILKSLIEAGADTRVATEDGDSPVLIATQYGYGDLIPILAAGKADLNYSNLVYTPLFYAAEQSNIDLIKILIASGVDVSAKTQGGRVALHEAIDSPEILKIFIDAKADLNATNSNGESALILAVQQSSLPVVQMLVEAGADINLQSQYGYSAYGYAQSNGMTEIAEYLKLKGGVEG